MGPQINVCFLINFIQKKYLKEYVQEKIIK